MKKYVSKMNTLLDIQHPDSECNCYAEFEMDEEFLCDICLTRLKRERRKIKRKLRRESKARYKKHIE